MNMRFASTVHSPKNSSLALSKPTSKLLQQCYNSTEDCDCCHVPAILQCCKNTNCPITCSSNTLAVCRNETVYDEDESLGRCASTSSLCGVGGI